MSQIELKKSGVKKSKRIGRGLGSGRGAYSGRGQKGQKARTGGGVRPGFEGGQMPLYRRLPKRGFKSLDHKVYNIINIASLKDIQAGSEVSPESLKSLGLIHANNRPVKLLGNGELKIKNLQIKVHAVSAQAKAKIEALGGTVTILN